MPYPNANIADQVVWSGMGIIEGFNAGGVKSVSVNSPIIKPRLA